jgi:quinol monooxygenase YgiN
MYARVTTYQADPARIKELRAKLPAIKEKLEEMDGIEDWYTVWRADGQGVVFTVFEDKETADASLNEVRGIWASLSSLLKGTPKVESFDNVETLED